MRAFWLVWFVLLVKDVAADQWPHFPQKMNATFEAACEGDRRIELRFHYDLRGYIEMDMLRVDGTRVGREVINSINRTTQGGMRTLYGIGCPKNQTWSIYFSGAVVKQGQDSVESKCYLIYFTPTEARLMDMGETC